jgi:hypothetical protein
MFFYCSSFVSSNATTFDFVLLLIIAETTQQALVGDDASVTGAFLLIVVLVGTDILLSLVKRWLPRVDQLLEGQPLVILRNGVPLRARMHVERIDEEDILSAAREQQASNTSRTSSEPCSREAVASRSCRAAASSRSARVSRDGASPEAARHRRHRAGAPLGPRHHRARVRRAAWPAGLAARGYSRSTARRAMRQAK